MPLHIDRRLQPKFNLRISKVLTGKRGIQTNPVTDLDIRQSVGTFNGETDVTIEQRPTLEVTSDHFADDRPFTENLTPWKDPAPQHGHRKSIIRKMRAALQLIKKVTDDKTLPLEARIQQIIMGREFTLTERLEIIEEDETKRLNQFHQEAARRLGRRIVESNANMGNCDFYVQGHKRVIRKKIRFDWVEHSPLVYRYHVDSRPENMPWGIKLYDLYQEAVVTTLSGSCGHPVRARNEVIGDSVTGLIYEVEIAATLGVPNKCFFADLLPRIPDSAPALAFMTGYSENKRINWQSLEDMPHFLGGGQTMGGKSNMMHVMLCCFIARNSPADVRLLLVDLKFDGIELSRYEGIPHLITGEVKDVEDGIACNPMQAVKVLEWAAREGEKRGRMFKEEKIQNIKLWNRKHSKRHLAEIVIAIDELSLLRLDRESGAKAYELIQIISSTARASGIHLIAFTQSSNKAIINELIKVNFPGRICFSVPDHSSSILFVNDGSAINLTPAGRAVFKHGTTKYIVQTPLIEPSEIDQVVKNAKAGKLSAKLDRVHLTPEEIIEWSIEDNNSSLSVRDVWNKFGTRISKDNVEAMLKGMEGQTYPVGDRAYQVLPGIGKKPRIVVRVDDKGVDVDQNPRDKTQDTAGTNEITEENNA